MVPGEPLPISVPLHSKFKVSGISYDKTKSGFNNVDNPLDYNKVAPKGLIEPLGEVKSANQ